MRIATFFKNGARYRLTRQCVSDDRPDEVIDFTADSDTVKTSGPGRCTVKTDRGYFCYDSGDEVRVLDGLLTILVNTPSRHVWLDEYEQIEVETTR